MMLEEAAENDELKAVVPKGGRDRPARQSTSTVR